MCVNINRLNNNNNNNEASVEAYFYRSRNIMNEGHNRIKDINRECDADEQEVE